MKFCLNILMSSSIKRPLGVLVFIKRTKNGECKEWRVSIALPRFFFSTNDLHSFTNHNI